MFPHLSRFDSRPLMIASLRLTFGAVVGATVFSARATGVLKGRRAGGSPSGASDSAIGPIPRPETNLDTDFGRDRHQPDSETLIVIVDDGGDLPVTP